MCYRIIQFLLLGFAVFSTIAIFLPWQHLLFLTDEQATTWLAAKMLLLPIPVLCVLGALWSSHKARNAAAPQPR